MNSRIISILFISSLFIKVNICYSQNGKINYIKDKVVSYKQDPNFFPNLAYEMCVKLSVKQLVKDEFETQTEYQARIDSRNQKQNEENLVLLNNISSITRTYKDIPVAFPKYDAERQEFLPIEWMIHSTNFTVKTEIIPKVPILEMKSSIPGLTVRTIDVRKGGSPDMGGGSKISSDIILNLIIKFSSSAARAMKESVSPGSEVSTSNLILNLDYRIENSMSPIFEIVGARIINAKNRIVLYSWGNSLKNVGEIDVSSEKESILTIGNFKDTRDGKVYKVAQIGTQVWMAENLNFNGGQGCIYYNNDPSYGKRFGMLYTWEVAKSVCPKGWHLPTLKEWVDMVSYAGEGKEAIFNLTSITGWEKQYNVVGFKPTNSSGFCALPGGLFSIDKKFRGLGEKAYFWTQRESVTNGYARIIWIDPGYDQVFTDAHIPKTHYLSVRCTKD